MLDEKDLQAIQSMIDAAEQRIAKSTTDLIDAAEQRITKSTTDFIDAAEQRITKNTVALMDMEFTKKFNFLSEGQQAILDKLVPRSRVDELEDEVKFLKVIVRQMTEDIQNLKKAN